jgi:hypothetical protein
VVPVEAGVGELTLAAVAAADRDRCLGLVKNPVEAVLQPQAMPVHRRLDVAVVAGMHGDLRPLLNMQGRSGDGAVVGEHPQVGAVQALADWTDAEVQAVTIPKPQNAWAGHFL